MGYFPNGTAGLIYEEQYCNRCIHETGPDGNTGCTIMLAHLIHNYDEANNKDSILHMLIPKSKDGIGNEQCRMFVAGKPPSAEIVTEADRKYIEWHKKRATEAAEGEVTSCEVAAL